MLLGAFLTFVLFSKKILNTFLSSFFSCRPPGIRTQKDRNIIILGQPWAKFGRCYPLEPQAAYLKTKR